MLVPKRRADSQESGETKIPKYDTSNLEIDSRLKKLGFSSINFTSIYGTSALIHKTFDFIQTQLVNQIDGINEILSLGFTISNLSSLLNKAGKKHLENKLSQLLCAESLEYLKEIIEQKVLQHQNISSILHSAAGAKNSHQLESIKTSIKVLHENIPIMNTLRDKGFSGENIGAMLNSIGINAEMALKSLDGNADKLISLSNETNFSLRNIITMIAGDGKDIDKAITDLYTCKGILQTIEADSVPKFIKACTRSGSTIATKIKSELEKYPNALVSDTIHEQPASWDLNECAKILLSLDKGGAVFDRSVETIGVVDNLD